VVRFATADLVTGLPAGTQAEVVLANIQADVLMRFVPELVGAVAPGGLLVLSGILAHENEKVRAAFAPAVVGWTVEHRPMGEWSDVALTRP
jgi:ribosomal protein L11 methyltransferase